MSERNELSDVLHEDILGEQPRTFPLESYRRLRLQGVDSALSLSMLGWSWDELGPELRAQLKIP